MGNPQQFSFTDLLLPSQYIFHNPLGINFSFPSSFVLERGQDRFDTCHLDRNLPSCGVLTRVVFFLCFEIVEFADFKISSAIFTESQNCCFQVAVLPTEEFSCEQWGLYTSNSVLI